MEEKKPIIEFTFPDYPGSVGDYYEDHNGNLMMVTEKIKGGVILLGISRIVRISTLELLQMKLIKYTDDRSTKCQ